MTPHVREGDPPDFDPRPVRQIDPGLWDLRLGYGRATLSVRGLAVIVLVAVAVTVGTNIWLARSQSVEHYTIRRTMERQACILALDFDERKALLSDRAPGAWRRACWWMSEETQE